MLMVSYCAQSLSVLHRPCVVNILAHLSLLRVSFWDTAMSAVRRTCGRPRGPIRPSVKFLACVHSRGNSFDPKIMKLCQNVNHHNIGQVRNWVMLGQKLGH